MYDIGWYVLVQGREFVKNHSQQGDLPSASRWSTDACSFLQGCSNDYSLIGIFLMLPSI